jgi:hypothetical protein
MHSGLRSLRDELAATLVRIFAYIGAVAVIAAVMAKLFESPVVAAIEPRQRSDWSTIERPYRAFMLRVPGFGDGEPEYAIRRHVAGGRKDVLRFAPEAERRSSLSVEVYRPGEEVTRFREPAGVVAALTSELGGPFPLAPSDPIDGKFGPIPVFEFTAQAAGHARNCAGFARAFDQPRLQIAGWYCKGDVEVVDRHMLACAIEGLSLLAAASEPQVQEFFARAERRRKFCKLKPEPRSLTLRRHDWIEARRGPKLRGQLKTR